MFDRRFEYPSSRISSSAHFGERISDKVEESEPNQTSVQRMLEAAYNGFEIAYSHPRDDNGHGKVLINRAVDDLNTALCWINVFNISIPSVLIDDINIVLEDTTQYRKLKSDKDKDE